METKIPETRLEIRDALKSYESSRHVVYSGEHGRISYVVRHLDGRPGAFLRTPEVVFVVEPKGERTVTQCDDLASALSVLDVPYAPERT